MALIIKNTPSFSSLFDDFMNFGLSDWKSRDDASTSTSLPKVNITENDEGFEIYMAAPGMAKGDFDIRVENEHLTISSNKDDASHLVQDTYVRKEFDYQPFTRTFDLPESVDGDKVSAAYENGVLTVSLPKKEEVKPRPRKQISIS